MFQKKEKKEIIVQQRKKARGKDFKPKLICKAN